MKRIFIALLLFALALCAGGLEVGYITAKVDMFISKIENADKLMKQSDYKSAFEQCKKIEDEWYECDELIDMLLIHDYVDSIGIKISRMTALAESKNVDFYMTESINAKKELASIKESEYPKLENLL